MNSNFFDSIGKDHKAIARFCVTQLQVAMACDIKNHFEGSVALPPTIPAHNIALACRTIAEAFSFLHTDSKITAVNENEFRIKPSNEKWEFSLQVKEYGLKFDSFGKDMSEIFNRGNILACIEAGHYNRPKVNLANIVNLCFANQGKAKVDQSQVENKTPTMAEQVTVAFKESHGRSR